ncbi:LysR family transcriptional regulator [Corynebacterium camporealensis]|uniref:LysR family transcriptional regulator n=1 Tax=Corynebacterium camporealensis TaxID=161896 RepID=UPI0034CEA244
MDRRLLETFRAVTKSGSVSKAAADLHLTQPAVSKQLKKLEDHLEIKLVQRTPNGIALTAAGDMLYDLSGDIINRINSAENLLKARFLSKTTFRVACPQPVSVGLVTPFMAATNPAISDILTGDAPDIDALLEHDADLGFSTIKPPANRDCLTIATLPLNVQGSKQLMDRLFGASKSIHVNQLTNYELLIPRTGAHTWISSVLPTGSKTPKITEVSTGRVAQALAANGHGIALVAEDPTFQLSSRSLIVSKETVSLPLYAFWDPDHYASDELRTLSTNFSDWLSTWYPNRPPQEF